jgi:hypothetical protein
VSSASDTCNVFYVVGDMAHIGEAVDRSDEWRIEDRQPRSSAEGGQRKSDIHDAIVLVGSSTDLLQHMVRHVPGVGMNRPGARVRKDDRRFGHVESLPISGRRRKIWVTALHLA